MPGIIDDRIKGSPQRGPMDAARAVEVLERAAKYVEEAWVPDTELLEALNFAISALSPPDQQ